MKRAVCPGSFDPITNGHVDIIKRAAELFDEVIVLTAVNQDKSAAFSLGERVDMIKKATAGIKNVRVDSFDGLLADYLRDNRVDAIVKGLRAVSDFEYEFQMALVNKKLYPDAQTVFLTANGEYTFLSSSVVKQVASFGGDISGFVPESVLSDILKRFRKE